MAEEHSVDWHRTHGQWQVRYPDGKISQPFTYDVAMDYYKLYGGEIIPVENAQEPTRPQVGDNPKGNIYIGAYWFPVFAALFFLVFMMGRCSK